ncbi:MAG: radical SAM protein [Cyanobacteria bacterium P01_A01_bin.17]
MFKLSKSNASVLLSQIKSPAKIFNDFGMRISYLLKLKQVPFLPSSLDIEPVNNCNFSCPHCQVTYWDKEVVHLQKSAFETLIEQLPNLVWIKLQGMGEPLLNKELVPMLEFGEQKNIRMSFTTNGSLLKGKLADRISKLRNTSIHLSIDGASAEVFEKIRVGSRFEVVCKNIKAFTDLVDVEDRQKFSAWMVLTKQNLHEVEDVIKLVKELGLGALTIQPFLNDWGKDEMGQHINEIKLSPDLVSSKKIHSALEKAQGIAIEQGVNLKIFDGDFYSKARKCSWPWKSAYICTNGDVVPCAILADSDTVKMGNIHEQSFSEIWNNDEYQDFRACHVAHDLPDHCKHCYLDA